MKKKINVRFAPSPTGFMHLGNVRAAFMNYLFAQKNQGSFILRIEDTDQERHIEEAVDRITQDLSWLGISFNQGPFFQSQRQSIYQEQLNEMITHQLVYRCFCSKEVLDNMREKQKAANLPPRYDRRCATLSQERIQRKLNHGLAFIWRFKIDQQHKVTLNDLAKGKVEFDLSHFSDFAITRKDGSFTFLLTNFIDDALMEITHVIRGEDHLSNTALQLAMYHATARRAPTYWHLPLICNEKGEKMSKRDFGFNLNDLKNEGFLAESIANYLIILGKSFSEEIQSIPELIKNYDFNNLSATSTIRYDKEKLEWVNQEWIQRLNFHELKNRIRIFSDEEYNKIKQSDEKKIEELLTIVKPGMKTIKELISGYSFYFIPPTKKFTDLSLEATNEVLSEISLICLNVLNEYESTSEALNEIKKRGKKASIQMKLLLTSLRMALTGVEKGIGVQELFSLFTRQELIKRITKFFGAHK